VNFNAATGTVNAVIFNSTSDASQKTNVSKIENAIDTVDKLEGVEFDWVKTGAKSSGIIAQQIEPVLPHLVTSDFEGMKSVNYPGLVGYLIEAIKELHQEIKQLRN